MKMKLNIWKRASFLLNSFQQEQLLILKTRYNAEDSNQLQSYEMRPLNPYIKFIIHHKALNPWIIRKIEWSAIYRKTPDPYILFTINRKFLIKILKFEVWLRRPAFELSRAKQAARDWFDMRVLVLLRPSHHLGACLVG